MTSETNKDEYYQAGQTWENDIHRSLRRSRSMAWVASGVMASVAILSLSALVMVLPLRSYEPYLVKVDKSTGYTEIVRTLKESDLTVTEREALTTAYLVRYLKARETYDPREIKSNFDLAQLLSTAAASADLTQAYAPSNQRSPDKLYGRNTRVAVTVKSVSLLNSGTASVRFLTEIKKDNTVQTNHWVGILKFRYTSVPKRNDWRFDNPQGFQVLDYRRDQETPAMPAGQEG